MQSKLNGVLVGVVFIVMGIGFAGEMFNWWEFNPFFDGWWTLFIIVPSIISLCTGKEKIRALIGLAVGIVLWISKSCCRPSLWCWASVLSSRHWEIRGTPLTIIKRRILTFEAFYQQCHRTFGRFHHLFYCKPVYSRGYAHYCGHVGHDYLRHGFKFLYQIKKIT
jgi:hypothetical protein